MACVAEKKAAYQATPVERQNIAVSIRASFDSISEIADLSIPLRRPARVCPSLEAEQEYVDTVLASEALADTGSVIPYDVCRKELGLSE